jgi:hypothetical protein
MLSIPTTLALGESHSEVEKLMNIIQLIGDRPRTGAELFSSSDLEFASTAPDTVLPR